MKVTQEKLPASQIGIEIEISAEKAQQTYEQVIQKFSRSANIPGFRKGKVPRQILLQRLGKVQVKVAALEELIQSSITEAIKQQEIPAIGQPQLRSDFEELITQYEPGKPLTLSAAVDVEPEISLDQYTGLQAQAEEVKYDPESVEKVLEENRREMATLIPVEGRAAQLGDIAVVDFQGYEDEGDEVERQEIPGAGATDFQVELDEGRFIPGFVDGIVGMNSGETKEISVQFPEDYPQKEVAGKAAVFTVTLKEIKEKELPELDDDFAREMSEFETLAELRSSLESRLRAEAERKTKSNKQQALSDEIVKHIEVDLPETLVVQEVDAMLNQTAMQLSNQGIDIKKLFTPEIIPQLRARSRPEAIDRIKRSLALREVGKRESIQVEPKEVEARVKELMAQYTDKDIDPNRLRQVVEEELLTEKIMNWLEDHFTIELVPEGSLKKADEEDIESEEEVMTLTESAQLSDAETDDIEPEEEVMTLTEPTTSSDTPQTKNNTDDVASDK